MVMFDGTTYLDTTEAAQRLGVYPGTLHNQRYEGRSEIAYVKVGRAILYRLADVEAHERLARSQPKCQAPR